MDISKLTEFEVYDSGIGDEYQRESKYVVPQNRALDAMTSDRKWQVTVPNKKKIVFTIVENYETILRDYKRIQI